MIQSSKGGTRTVQLHSFGLQVFLKMKANEELSLSFTNLGSKFCHDISGQLQSSPVG